MTGRYRDLWAPEEHRTGHPIVAAVLGLLGLAVALILIYPTGLIGGVIALALGVAAFVLGVKSRHGGRGWPGLLMGLLACVLAVIYSYVSIGTIRLIYDTAKSAGNAPLVEKYAANPYFGYAGVLQAAANDHADMELFNAQLNDLQQRYEAEHPMDTQAPAGETTQSTATQAPAGEAAPAATQAPAGN